MRKFALMLLALTLVALVPPTTVAAAACHWTAPCGPEYGACTSWSSADYCDAPICSQHERECGDPQSGPGWGPGLVQPAENYRVCFNSSGQSCTEYQHFWVNVGCGC